MAGSGRRSPTLICPALPRPVACREPLPRQSLEEDSQSPVQDLREITIRNLMTKEVLGEAELVAELGSRGELHTVAFQSERRDDRRTRRSV